MRILVVEDDLKLHQSLVRNLEDEGYLVTAAMEGEEGLYLAENWPFDLIVLDVMLPKLNGFDLLERLRHKKIKTPVLMLTARDMVMDRIRGLDAGADDYLVKPFDVSELFARLRSLLRRAYGITSETLTIGAVSVALKLREVTLDGQLVKLTPSEYLMLEMLALRKGTVVSTGLLADVLSYQGRDIAVSSIEVHVHNVRRKLGKAVIETVRGHGYRIGA